MDKINRIHRILCRLNFHNWRYWRMATSFYVAFPEMQCVNRTCTVCGLMQCTEDGENWTHRI